jgi:hypothetical protein
MLAKRLATILPPLTLVPVPEPQPFACGCLRRP